MDLLDLKKLALLGIAGGLLLTAGDHNTIYAGEHGDSDSPEKEANGCNGCNGHDDSDDDEESEAMDDNDDENGDEE